MEGEKTMACFIVSAAEAAVVAKIEKKEREVEKCNLERMPEHVECSIPWSRKLKWLKNLLSGGSVLLLFEHIWHGEIVPWFPFLTAMTNPHDAVQMLKEMATVGVSMALLITFVWCVMCKVADAIVSRPEEELQEQ